MQGVIYFVSGPPASGKTTFSELLVQRFAKGLHIPVDDMRLWVKSGLADSVPWTEETERQFQIVEVATCAIAKIYLDQGFHVVVDHCRNPHRLEALISEQLPGCDVRKILLLPSLDVNLRRNAHRTNKPFPSRTLEETIRWTHENYGESIPKDWTVVDNTAMSPQESIDFAMSEAKAQHSR
jgi:tRNA uridine 5-carbamoylmethylation protein Kti12